MPSSCPVCEQPIASTAAHCPVCGFPTALAIEGLRSIADAAPEEPHGNGHRAGPTAPPAAAGGGMAPLSPEAELNATISLDLRAKMDQLQGLGRAPDVTSDLCQAALIEAEGRDSEALEILRAAQVRLDRETEQFLQDRRSSLRDRRDALQKSGVRFAFRTDFARIDDALNAGDRTEAGRLFAEAERRLTQFESDWRGLQRLLAQIDALRAEAVELGFPLGEITGEVAAIRDRLAQPEITEEVLDSIAQQSAQTLMLLHEAIPASIEEELKRTGESLDHYPEEHTPAAAARRLHLEAGRHLRKGRIPEAIQGIRDLRRALEELENAPEPASAAAPLVPPPPPAEGEDEMLGRLLRKARTLAGRVRTLPPEGETSREAAIQIREATELLRMRRLQEADETLSRLMRMLAAESGGG